MHFILLGVGFILGVIGLYRFFMNASIKQISAAFMVAGFVVICIALFYLAVTGRLPAAIGLVAALWPLALSWYHNKHKQKEEHKQQAQQPSQENLSQMSHKEALEVLNLKETPGNEEIKQAHKKLMKKVHPDQEGSAWMAQKLNQARDVLLKK